MSTSDLWSRLHGFWRIAALAAFSLLAVMAAPAMAATDTLHAAPAATGSGNCSSAANACTVATAVTNANAASVADSVVIKLASGSYALSSPTPIALPITFAGPSLTLEPESGTPVLSGTDTVGVLSVAAGSNVTVDGLTIEHGSTAGLGGGIQNNGTLTVTRSTFSDNRAANGGAISDAAAATLTVRDSTFSHGTATSVGGGAIIAFGPTTVERSAILDNTAPINGGGLNVQPGGTVTLTNSTIAGNTSGGLGGGMSNLGTLTVQSSTIADNGGNAGEAIATGNANVTFAADIIAAQASGGTLAACNPVNAAITDGGYNLDTDGTCISPTAPATGSHNGTTALGSSTYGAVLAAYLADAPGNHGGPTATIPLLNSPSPATTQANPAFDVVPPSFALPTAIGGVTKACGLADQRGVVPVAGANCAIGAYLLQATKTAVVAPAATAGRDVTLTARITPAANGGTVAFVDGAGNPATTHCGARPVSGGTATCTVAYANPGTYRVTASYSGDGAGNNFAPSASAAQTVTVAPAPPPPPPPAMLQCTGREITLLDIRVVSGGRAIVRGVTLASHSGRTVTVRTGTKRLDTAKVAADGSFTARFKLPRSSKDRLRLTAEVAGKKSRAFAVERRFVILSRVRHGKRVRITARVTGGKRGATVTIRRQVSCKSTRRYGKAKLGKHGRFTLSLPLASAADGVTFYRATTRIPHGATFTLPIAVTTKG